MAAVYKAYDPSIDRSLVIKFLHAELCATTRPDALSARGRATGMLASQHRNGIRRRRIEDRPYIAVELLDGGPLSEMLTEGQGLACGGARHRHPGCRR
jgi:serine/threonine-protein kinase